MLKHLNLDEMVALVTPWVEDPDQRKLFLAIPEIAALHPKVLEAHQTVLAARPSSSGTSPAMRAILDQLGQVDDRHDHLARAVSFGIDAHREHCLAADPPDAARAAQGEALQKQLFPTGLAILNASPLAESGNTARIARFLEDEPEIVAFLKAIPVQAHASLFDTVQRWIALGQKLQAVERGRAELAAAETTTPPSKATIHAARNQWFKIVSLVLGNLEVASASLRVVETLRGPVLRASERAGKRYATGKPTGSDADPDAEPAAPVAEPADTKTAGDSGPA